MTEHEVATYVLDASAVLAYLHGEPGADLVRAALRGAVISSVNWSEVAQKSLAQGRAVAQVWVRMEALGLSVAPFTQTDADTAAELWQVTHERGLSLADRACLALGQRLGRPVLTADRSWDGLPGGVDVQVLR